MHFGQCDDGGVVQASQDAVFSASEQKLICIAGNSALDGSEAERETASAEVARPKMCVCVHVCVYACMCVFGSSSGGRVV